MPPDAGGNDVESWIRVRPKGRERKKEANGVGSHELARGLREAHRVEVPAVCLVQHRLGFAPVIAADERDLELGAVVRAAGVGVLVDVDGDQRAVLHQTGRALDRQRDLELAAELAHLDVRDVQGRAGVAFRVAARVRAQDLRRRRRSLRPHADRQRHAQLLNAPEGAGARGVARQHASPGALGGERDEPRARIPVALRDLVDEEPGLDRLAHPGDRRAVDAAVLVVRGELRRAAHERVAPDEHAGLSRLPGIDVDARLRACDEERRREWDAPVQGADRCRAAEAATLDRSHPQRLTAVARDRDLHGETCLLREHLGSVGHAGLLAEVALDRVRRLVLRAEEVRDPVADPEGGGGKQHGAEHEHGQGDRDAPPARPQAM